MQPVPELGIDIDGIGPGEHTCIGDLGTDEIHEMLATRGQKCMHVPGERLAGIQRPELHFGEDRGYGLAGECVLGALECAKFAALNVHLEYVDAVQLVFSDETVERALLHFDRGCLNHVSRVRPTADFIRVQWNQRMGGIVVVQVQLPAPIGRAQGGADRVHARVGGKSRGELVEIVRRRLERMHHGGREKLEERRNRMPDMGTGVDHAERCRGREEAGKEFETGHGESGEYLDREGRVDVDRTRQRHGRAWIHLNESGVFNDFPYIGETEVVGAVDA